MIAKRLILNGDLKSAGKRWREGSSERIASAIEIPCLFFKNRILLFSLFRSSLLLLIPASHFSPCCD